MPPPTTVTDPAQVIRHLTRLLGALCLRSKGGELRISQSVLDQLKAEDPARALFEYFDFKSGQTVLQFRHKALATYLVEEQSCQPQTLSAQRSQQTLTQPQSPGPRDFPPPSTPSDTSIRAQPPLTDQQLLALETKARQIRVARSIRRPGPQPSSNPLDEILSG